MIVGSGDQTTEVIVGVKLKLEGVKDGAKLIPQLKIYPLSEPKLSVTVIVQIPFKGLPNNDAKD